MNTRLELWLCFWVMFAVAGATSHAQQSTPRPDTTPLSKAVGVVADARKIVTPQGIEENRAIPINGIQQWISVRGKDRRNPILLVLHGGPGSAEMPDDWTFQTPWEDYFTVVEWDQRGAGKTYSMNDPKIIAPTMTVPQMVSDTEQVIQYLQRTYSKQRIILLGHSWGTVLGVMIAQKHPGWLYAYVGVGQWINTQRSEREGYDFVLSQAKTENNGAAIKELEALAPYPGVGAAFTLDRVNTERKWVMFYGGLAWGRKDYTWDVNAWDLSPDYTQSELDAVSDGTGYSISNLLPMLTNIDFDRTTTFHCPIFLFMGEHDHTTSYTVAETWFHTVRAPKKEFVRFYDAAHMVMQEEPGRFLLHLVNDVRPIAEKAGDAAPDEIVKK